MVLLIIVRSMLPFLIAIIVIENHSWYQKKPIFFLDKCQSLGHICHEENTYDIFVMYSLLYQQVCSKNQWCSPKVKIYGLTRLKRVTRVIEFNLIKSDDLISNEMKIIYSFHASNFKRNSFLYNKYFQHHGIKVIFVILINDVTKTN